MGLFSGHRPAVTAASPCPCGLAQPYGMCCRPHHRGEATVPTAELLMRARYTAFAIGDADYLLTSWHPSTRPEQVHLDHDQDWKRLEILGTTGGTLFDTAGTVEFRAHYGVRGMPGVLHEDSAFVRESEQWQYVAPSG